TKRNNGAMYWTGWVCTKVTRQVMSGRNPVANVCEPAGQRTRGPRLECRPVNRNAAIAGTNHGVECFGYAADNRLDWSSVVERNQLRGGRRRRSCQHLDDGAFTAIHS